MAKPTLLAKGWADAIAPFLAIDFFEDEYWKGLIAWPGPMIDWFVLQDTSIKTADIVMKSFRMEMI